MTRYRVLKVFIDTHSKKSYQIGQEIELSQERFDEAEKNLEPFGGGFLEIVTDEENDETDITIPQLKEKLTDLEIKFNSKATKPQLEKLLAEAEKNTENEKG